MLVSFFIERVRKREKARTNLDAVSAKWSEKYPHSMNRWYDNWDAVCPIFKFSMEVRKVIYTTNAIESVNSTYKKLNRQRSCLIPCLAFRPTLAYIYHNP